MIPELIGRLPVVSFLNPLDHSAFAKILTEPKNALVKQYKKLFEMENIEVEFKEGALDFIVEKAVDFKLGARGFVPFVKPSSTMPCLRCLLKKQPKTGDHTRLRRREIQ